MDWYKCLVNQNFNCWMIKLRSSLILINCWMVRMLRKYRVLWYHNLSKNHMIRIKFIITRMWTKTLMKLSFFIRNLRKNIMLSKLRFLKIKFMIRYTMSYEEYWKNSWKSMFLYLEIHTLLSKINNSYRICLTMMLLQKYIMLLISNS